MGGGVNCDDHHIQIGINCCDTSLKIEVSQIN